MRILVSCAAAMLAGEAEGLRALADARALRVPTPVCAGPWDPNSLHGRVVAGLLAYEIERSHGAFLWDPEEKPDAERLREFTEPRWLR